MKLQFIVNGTLTSVTVKDKTKTPVIEYAKKAQKQAGYDHRPLDDFLLIHDDKHLRSYGEAYGEHPMKTYGLKDGDLIFMSLKAGVGA